MPESYVFAHLADDSGLHHREVRLEPDGSQVIGGHDLGETEERLEELGVTTDFRNRIG